MIQLDCFFFRTTLPLPYVCATETTNLETSIGFICQDFLAQSERPYSSFENIYPLPVPVLEKW